MVGGDGSPVYHHGLTAGAWHALCLVVLGLYQRQDTRPRDRGTPGAVGPRGSYVLPRPRAARLPRLRADGRCPAPRLAGIATFACLQG